MLIIPDVSFYQDDPNTPRQIDFAQMKRAGAAGVIIRAGQNVWSDPDVAFNMTKAKEAGLPRGSYFFYDSRVSPAKQIDTWQAALNGDLPELGLWADFEDRYGGPYGKENHFREFMELVKDAFPTSVEVGVYTAYYYWIERVKSHVYWHQYPLWVANYDVQKPQVPPPWSADEWSLWQFTDRGDGHKYGVESSRIDLNYYNGDLAAFYKQFNIAGEVPQPELHTVRIVLDNKVYVGELREVE